MPAALPSKHVDLKQETKSLRCRIKMDAEAFFFLSSQFDAPSQMISPASSSHDWTVSLLYSKRPDGALNRKFSWRIFLLAQKSAKILPSLVKGLTRNSRLSPSCSNSICTHKHHV